MTKVPTMQSFDAGQSLLMRLNGLLPVFLGTGDVIIVKLIFNMAIVQPLNARPEKRDCNTHKMGMTELFLVIDSGVVGKFRDSSHDHCEDEI